MKIICTLSDWKETTAKRGKYKGKIVRTRKVLGLDSWNWVLATQTNSENGPISQDKFFGNIKMFLEFYRPKRDLLDFIIYELATGLDIQIDTLPARPLSKDMSATGKWIDDNFDTSLMKKDPTRVFKKIFGNKNE
jgi:hypothetical protein